MTTHHKLWILGLIILSLISFNGCSLGMVKEGKPLALREDVAIPENLIKRKYDINVRYFNQTEIGITRSIDEIAASVTHYVGKDKGDYYRWDDYRIRHFDLDENEDPIESGMEYDRLSSDDKAPWVPIEEAEGYSYFLENGIVKGNQLTNLPKTDFIRRDIDGFRFYLNLIDFHMWDIYTSLIKHLKEKGDEYKKNEEGHVIDILTWENVNTHAEMEGGHIYVQHLGNSQTQDWPSSQYYFQQNQRLSMNLVAPLSGRLVFNMPYQGSNRFMGIFEIDRHGKLIQAHFNEYVYGKVNAPFFINVLTYHKREYVVTRIE